MMGPFTLLAASYMVGKTLRNRKAADRAIALRKAEARAREERAKKAKAKAAREVEERRMRALKSAERRAREAEARALAAEARAAEAPTKAEPKPRPLVPLPKPPRPVAVTKSTPKTDKVVATKVKTQPEPWPAVVPSGLPPFPGPGWVPDRPERPEVIARAVQLIQPLHARGVGSSVVEHIGGRWVGFVARMHAGNKRAVEAYRPKDAAPKATAAAMPVVVQPVTKAAATAAPKPEPKPKPKPAAPVRPTLREGAVGSDVVRLQKYLGFQGTEIDGKFGPKTLARVKAFQKGRSLVVDGVVGKKTWAALEGKRVARPTLRLHSTGPDVEVLQRALGIAADGIFGSATHQSVRNFQREQRLVMDGVCGPKTWEALGNP